MEMMDFGKVYSEFFYHLKLFINSFFISGKNFVFDNRLTMGAEDLLKKENEPSLSSLISSCFFCENESARYQKCSGEKCHVYIIVCSSCLSTSSPSSLPNLFFCCEGCSIKHSTPLPSSPPPSPSSSLLPNIHIARESARDECFCDVTRAKKKKS